MNRRDTVLLLLALGATPIASLAQPKGKVWRIGFLYPSTSQLATTGLGAFKETLRELGYVEGRDYVLEARFADNNYDRLPKLAEELVAWNPDVIVANLALTVRAAQMATSTIPIVMVQAGDPIGSGLVKSLASPGGNVTGMSNSLTDIAPKHLALLRETLPDVTRLAVVMNPKYQSHLAALKTLQEEGPRIGIQVLPIEAEATAEIERGLAARARQNAQAVIVVTDAIYTQQLPQIADAALRHKLAAIGYSGNWATGGFLIGYGPNGRAFYKHAAVYTDKILKGAKPRDLPVAQPTTFELFINLKTAKALGLKIPESVLIRADRIIE